MKKITTRKERQRGLPQKTKESCKWGDVETREGTANWETDRKSGKTMKYDEYCLFFSVRVRVQLKDFYIYLCFIF